MSCSYISGCSQHELVEGQATFSSFSNLPLWDEIFSENTVWVVSSTFYVVQILVHSHFDLVSSVLLQFATKVSLSYHLCVECFSQLSFVSEMYTKSSAVADFVYTSESNNLPLGIYLLTNK